MPEHLPFGERSDILTPVSDSVAALAAMIEATRAATRALERVEGRLGAVEQKVNDVQKDVAVINERDANSSWMAAELNDIGPRLTALEMRNAQQDGAFKFTVLLKDFGPWAVSIAMGVLLYLKQ